MHVRNWYLNGIRAKESFSLFVDLGSERRRNYEEPHEIAEPVTSSGYHEQCGRIEELDDKRD